MSLITFKKLHGYCCFVNLTAFLTLQHSYYALRCRGEIGKTADFVRRNIADMQKSFE